MIKDYLQFLKCHVLNWKTDKIKTNAKSINNAVKTQFTSCGRAT